MSNSINAEFPALTIGQPTEGDGYLIVARQLLPGIEALSTLPNVPPRSCALLAAHASECAVKAFLWHKGKGKAIHDAGIRHDLNALWALAYEARDLPIPQTPPLWIQVLSAGHGPAFYFRYQEGERKTVVHGGQTPSLIPMAQALKSLIEQVEHAVR